MKAWMLLGVAMIGFMTATPAASAADKVIMQSDWLPSGDKAPAYVALNEGFFAEEGLDVTIMSGRGATEALTKVATGVADVGTGGLGSLMSAAAENPLPVHAIYSIYNKPPEALLTTTDSGVMTLKDLIGRRMAASGLSSSRVVWPLVLAMNGMEEKQINMKLVDANAVVPLLASGQVDAVSSYLTIAPAVEKILQTVGKRVRALPWSTFGLQGYSTALFASDRMIADRPQVLARFLRAYRRGVELASTDPVAAARAVKKSAPELDIETIADQVRAATPLMKNELTDRDGLGAFNPGLLRATWEWVAKSQNYPLDRIDPEKLMARSILPPS